MEFRNLCTLETFRDVCSPSGYSENLEDVINKEFTRIKGNLRGVKWSVCCGPMRVYRLYGRLLNHGRVSIQESPIWITQAQLCTPNQR